MATVGTDIAAVQSRFAGFVDRVRHRQRLGIVCHSDVDGLAAAAITARTLARLGFRAAVHVTRIGETAWHPSLRARLKAARNAGLVVLDQGSRPEPLLDNCPTLLIDHHRPEGVPPDASLITGYYDDPVPTSGLLAYWCCGAVAETSDLKWIAALSILGEHGKTDRFPLLREAQLRYGAAALRDASTLLKTARRSAAGYVRPALSLLLRADGPAALVQGASTEARRLHAARQEVNAAFAECKKAVPQFSAMAALVRVSSPCQVHPLLAQMWRRQLPSHLVICANTGLRPGEVHACIRGPDDVCVADFFRERGLPAAADALRRCSDPEGALVITFPEWREMASRLGFEGAAADFYLATHRAAANM